MAYSPLYHTGNGVTTDYNISWDYLDKDFVKVLVNGVSVGFTWISDTVIRCSAAPAVGARVAIVRQTTGEPITEWGAGVTILGEDLNLATRQALHLAEEADAIVDTAIAASDTVANVYDAKNKRIINLANGGAGNDAVNKAQLDVEASTRAAADTAEANARIAGDASTLNSAKEYTDIREASILAEMTADAAAAEAAKNTAVTKAGEASASATAAAASAVEAAASASSAAASVVAAASSYDQFDDRFLGSKTSDPTVDNDGNALVVGALYYNSVIGKVKVYNGVGWQLAFNDTTVASAIPNDSSTVSGANVAAALDTLKTLVDGKAATSHTHTIANVTGLQTALDGKAASSHTHAIADTTGLQTALDAKFDKSGGTLTGDAFSSGTVGSSVSGAAASVTATGGNAQLYLSKSGTGKANRVHGLSGGVIRWIFDLGNDLAEAGSNTGSDLYIHRHADNGAYLGVSFSINRASGEVFLEGSRALTAANLNTVIPRLAADAGAVSGDLNAQVSSGFYRLNPPLTNGPGGVDYGQMLVSRGSDTAVQVCWDSGIGKMAFRAGSAIGGTPAWSAWRTVIHDGNIATYAPGPQESGWLSVPSPNTTVSWTHGLGTRPRLFGATAICIDAGGDGGYSQWDAVRLDNWCDFNNSAAQGVSANGTVVKYHRAPTTSWITVPGGNTGSSVALDPAKWNIRLWAIL